MPEQLLRLPSGSSTSPVLEPEMWVRGRFLEVGMIPSLGRPGGAQRARPSCWLRRHLLEGPDPAVL